MTDPVLNALSTIPVPARTKIQTFFEMTDPRSHAWVLMDLESHGVIALTNAIKKRLAPLLPPTANVSLPNVSLPNVSLPSPESPESPAPVSSVSPAPVSSVSPSPPVSGNVPNNKKNKKKKRSKTDTYTLANGVQRCDKGFKKSHAGSRHCVPWTPSKPSTKKTSTKKKPVAENGNKLSSESLSA